MMEKSRSSDVNGAPSCQRILGRSFHVVSIVPSGLMRQVPASTEVCSTASMGTQPPRSFGATSWLCGICLINVRPLEISYAVVSFKLKMLGSLGIAKVRVGRSRGVFTDGGFDGLEPASER